MADRDPVELSLHCQRMALLKWARNDPKAPDAAPARARAGLEARFLREADPDGVPDPAERAVRADRIRKACYAELARKSVVARRRGKAAPPTAGEAA
jgi:hypothetical protein